jgi:hypothetical protein
MVFCPRLVTSRQSATSTLSLVAFWCSFLILFQVLALAADGQVTRDPQALALIQKAVDAIGGVAAFAGIQDCTVQGQVQVAPDSPFYDGGFIWKNAGREFRYENPRADGTQILVSGHGKPALQENGSVSPTTLQAGIAKIPPHLMPRLLVDALQNPNVQVSPISDGKVAGKPAIQIALSDASTKLAASLTSQVWFFDSTSALPLRVEYRVPSNGDANITVGAAVEFLDFRVVSGIVVPFQLVLYQEDPLDSVLTLKSVQFNTGIDPSEFDLLSGGGQ